MNRSTPDELADARHRNFDPDPGLVISRPPRLERYRNAHATPFSRNGNIVRGALYDENGDLIELSRRVSGLAGDHITLDDPKTVQPPNASPLEGRGCYIGHIYNHFGHFLIEGLSSLWAGSDFDYYAAHPFIFGGLLPGYARYMMGRLGLNLGRLHVIRHPMIFADITVPERTWVSNKAVICKFREVAEHISKPFQSGRTSLRIYLSRSKINLRSIPNESAIEDIFGKNGFLVIHPERLDIEAQLSLYGQADIIAGFCGSALHNLLLCPRGTRTILLGDDRSMDRPLINQNICAALMGGRTTMIPYQTSADGFDLSYLEQELRASLQA